MVQSDNEIKRKKENGSQFISIAASILQKINILTPWKIEHIYIPNTEGVHIKNTPQLSSKWGAIHSYYTRPLKHRKVPEFPDIKTW